VTSVMLATMAPRRGDSMLTDSRLHALRSALLCLGQARLLRAVLVSHCDARDSAARRLTCCPTWPPCI